MKRLLKAFHTPRGGALLAALLTLLVLLPAWLWLGNWYRGSLIKQERAKVAEQISARANALTSAVNQRIALLQGLYAFTRTEWPDTHFDEPFEIYSSGLYFNSTGLRTLMIAPEGIARYIYPLFDTQTLSGYDILNDPDPDTRADVQRAIHTRQITMSQPGQLRQGGFGLTAWRAVYRGKDLWGLVSIALDMHTILADSGLSDPLSGLNVALQDNNGHTFFGPNDLWQQDPASQQIELPEGAWQLGGVPQGGWEAPVQPQETLFRLGSLAILLLATGVVYLTVNRQGRLAQAVAQRTREIAAARQELEQRVEERTRELSTLLAVSQRVSSTLALEPLLAQILAEMKNVIDYNAANIFRLDDAGRLVLVSQAGSMPPAGDGRLFSLLDEFHMDQAIVSRQPVIVHDWNADGLYAARTCWMGIPLVVKDQAMGMFAFVHRDPQYYQPEDAHLALAFAQQVATAIENARLYEQAGQLAVLEERQRLARELHDSVSQVLYSIGLGAKAARAALDTTRDPAQTADALDYVSHLAEAGQVEMRALIFELRPESLRIDGLVVALEKQAAVLRARYDLDVQVDLGQEPPVPLAVKEAVYRVAQEATQNIIRHAHATQVSLALTCDGQQLCLEVVDNGSGFDAGADYPGHLGLRTMRERAAQNRGQIQIESAPGRGTKVQFTIPFGQ